MPRGFRPKGGSRKKHPGNFEFDKRYDFSHLDEKASGALQNELKIAELNIRNAERNNDELQLSVEKRKLKYILELLKMK